jgi:predicted aspartyl protease
MLPFRQQIEIGPPDGPRSQRILALVDPASAYSVMPAAALTMVGLEPQWTQGFQLAAGGVEERQMAEIKVRLEGPARTTVCVFGGTESEPVLGKHTLDAFGLAFDGDEENLVPVRFDLG